jgi:hypothetical protein
MTARPATGFASVVTSWKPYLWFHTLAASSAGRDSTGRVGVDRPSARLRTVTRHGTPGWSLVAANLRLARGAHPHDLEEHPMNKGREEDPRAWPSTGSGLETGSMASRSEPLLRPCIAQGPEIKDPRNDGRDVGLALRRQAVVVGARVLKPSAGIVVDLLWEPEPTGDDEPAVGGLVMGGHYTP